MTSGGLGAWAYEVGPSNMPLHPGVTAELHAQADYGYRHLSPAGFVVDLSAPEVARSFAALYDKNGVSRCAEIPADELKLLGTIYPGTVAWELLGWPAAADIDPADETWQLATDAVKEIRRLSVYGAAGTAASEQTTAANVLEVFVQMERDAQPLDAVAFNAYHHGGKMLRQKLGYFQEALHQGEADGAEMPALRTLVGRLEHAQAATIGQFRD